MSANMGRDDTASFKEGCAVLDHANNAGCSANVAREPGKAGERGSSPRRSIKSYRGPFLHAPLSENAMTWIIGWGIAFTLFVSLCNYLPGGQ